MIGGNSMRLLLNPLFPLTYGLLLFCVSCAPKKITVIVRGGNEIFLFTNFQPETKRLTVVRELHSGIPKEITEQEYTDLPGSYVFSKALAYEISETLLDFKELKEDYDKLKARCGN